MILTFSRHFQTRPPLPLRMLGCWMKHKQQLYNSKPCRASAPVTRGARSFAKMAVSSLIPLLDCVRKDYQNPTTMRSPLQSSCADRKLEIFPSLEKASRNGTN